MQGLQQPGLCWANAGRNLSCVPHGRGAIIGLVVVFLICPPVVRRQTYLHHERRRCGAPAARRPFTRRGFATCRPVVRPVRASPRDAPLGRRLSVSASPPAELEAVIEPMLAAIVRLAGADAGTVRVIASDGMCYEPMVAVGIPGIGNGARADARSAWCNECAESRDAASECVKNEICGNTDRFPADVLGALCKHIVSVPLRHRDFPVGVLNLMFEAESLAPGRDDAAVAGDRRSPWHDARQCAPRAREPADPAYQRTADAGERSPRFARPGTHLHADAHEPAARRHSWRRRAEGTQVLERCR